MQFWKNKKIASIILILSLALSLSACNKDKDTEEGSSGVTPSEASTSASTTVDSSSEPDGGVSSLSSQAEEETEDAASSGSASSAGADTGDDSSSREETNSTSDVSSQEDGSVSGITPESEAAPTAAVSTGRFFHYDEERYTDDRAPYLELNEDGTATFMVHSGTYLGEASGTYSAQGGTLVFTVDDLEIEEDFWGDEARSLSFQIVDENNLRYMGDTYGLTLSGNVFTLEGASYTAPSGPLPTTAEETAAPTVSTSLDASQAAPVSSQMSPEEKDTSTIDSSASQENSTPASSPSETPESMDIQSIAPGQAPPDKINVGDSFTMEGLDLNRLTYDSNYFLTTLDKQTGSATFFAKGIGDTTIEYELEEGGNGLVSHPIKIVKKNSLGLIIVVGIVSLIAGGLLAVFLVNLMRKRKETMEARAIVKAEKKEKRDNAKNLKKQDKMQKKAEKANKAAALASEKARQAEQAVEGVSSTSSAPDSEKDTPAPDEKKKKDN